MPKTEIFIGNLNKEITQKEIEDVFDKYGRMVRCDIKNRGNIYLFIRFTRVDPLKSNEIHIYIYIY